MPDKSSTLSYHGKQITVTAAQSGPQDAAHVTAIQIDGAPVAFGPGDIEPGDSLDDAIDNGIRLATRMVDY